MRVKEAFGATVVSLSMAVFANLSVRLAIGCLGQKVLKHELYLLIR